MPCSYSQTFSNILFVFNLKSLVLHGETVPLKVNLHLYFMDLPPGTSFGLFGTSQLNGDVI